MASWKGKKEEGKGKGKGKEKFEHIIKREIFINKHRLETTTVKTACTLYNPSCNHACIQFALHPSMSELYEPVGSLFSRGRTSWEWDRPFLSKIFVLVELDLVSFLSAVWSVKDRHKVVSLPFRVDVLQFLEPR